MVDTESAVTESGSAPKWTFKQKLVAVALLAALGCYVYFGSRAENQWAQNTVDEMFRRNWQLASADRRDALSIMQPWRLFTGTVTGLSFINLDEMVRRSPSVRMVPVAHVRIGQEPSILITAFDCKTRQIAVLSDDEDPRTIPTGELHWFDPIVKDGRVTVDFVCLADFDTLVPHPEKAIVEALSGWPILKN